MNSLHVLDCTLRDGGYCNQWTFGKDNISKIIGGLVDAGIDIIECGFLTETEKYNKNITKFNTIEQISRYIPKKDERQLFVAMINYGEYNIDQLPVHNEKNIDGIRIAFHKKDLAGALECCKKIKNKGYKLFVQPMVSLSYSDEEFLGLICEVNKIGPYAFYIVDSFGMMKGKDLTRLFYLVEHNLDKKIWIGFHSHNNMQLAYSNAQTLVSVKTNRNLVVDSSVYGMGRGAGNLNTELFIDYLNENYDKQYELKPLLTIIDDILNGFYQRNYWGYSLPNYISATHSAHPNYASYLDDKKTMTVEGISEIFEMMEEEKKLSFDKNYIEKLYLTYMTTGKVKEEHKEELRKKIQGKKILLVAPGKSSVDEKEKIINVSQNNDILSISVNFDYAYVKTDFVFVSNLRRFKELNMTTRKKCIVTSNIPARGVYLQAKYKDLVNSIEAVSDNAGLMAIALLIQYGAEEIILAGFDGYSHDEDENYAVKSMELITKRAVLDAMNDGMTRELRNCSRFVKLTFLTTPKYINVI